MSEIVKKDAELLSILNPFAAMDLNDEEISKNIESAVLDILAMDERFQNADIQIVDAIKDWVRAEAVIRIAFRNYLTGKGTSKDERLFRSAMIMKNSLREEIFGKDRSHQKKKDELDRANQILVDHKIIEANTENKLLD